MRQRYAVLLTLCLPQAGVDAGNMVKSTCATFLKTLEECMQIATHTFSLDVATQSPPGSPPVAAVKPRKVSLNISVSPEINQQHLV